MIKYTNNYIKSQLVLNVSTNTILPTSTNKYGIQISWATSNQTVATIENGVVTVNPAATNLSSINLEASLSRNGQLISSDVLSYSVNVFTSSNILTFPESIKDQNLYNYLVQKFGTGGILTTDSFFSINNLDNKWYSLDLSYDTLGYYITDISGIGYITSLRYLNISGQNHLTDFTEISSLKNLEVLIADDVNMSSTMENGYSLFRNLKELYAVDLSNNHLQSIDGLNELDRSKLEILYLQNNQISDISFLSEFTNIKKLVLSNNNLNDISALGSLSSLDFLYLDHNCISNIEALKNLRLIETLRLDHQETVKGDGISSLMNIDVLANVLELKNLYINNNIIVDIDCLGSLSKIVVINAANNEIESMSALNVFSNMQYLNLENNNISGSTVPISKMTNLETLRLEGNNFSAGTYFNTTVKDLTKLRELSISSENSGFIINDLGFLANMPNLEHLSIPYNRIPQTFSKTGNETTIIYDNVGFIANLTKLKYLDISGNNFNDISSISNLIQLEQLYVNDLHVSFVDDEGLFLFTNFSNLKALSLVNTGLDSLKYLDDPWLLQLRKLQYLNLSYNNFTQVNITDIYNAARGKTLNTLYIDSNQVYRITRSLDLVKFGALERLSIVNGNLDNQIQFPQNLKYLNISNDIAYDFSYIENSPELREIVMDRVSGDISSLINLDNLHKLSLTLVVPGNVNYRKNIETLKLLYGRNAVIQMNGNEFTPNAIADGTVVLNQILENKDDIISVDLDNQIVDANGLFLVNIYDDFQLTWKVSLNGTDYSPVSSEDDLISLLNGKPADGILYINTELEIYGTKVHIDYSVNYKIIKLLRVNYYDSHNNVIKKVELEYGSKPENLSISVPGYTLNGWYTTNDYQTLYNFDSALTANKNIYGQYTANTYTVTFKAKGEVVDTKGYTYDGSYDLSVTSEPGKDYYQFVGWCKGEDDEFYQTQSEALDNIISNAGDAFKYENDITLSSVWSQTNETYKYISSLSQLKNMSLDQQYMLISDITFDSTWTPLGDFSGVLDGNNKTITTQGTIKFEISDDNDLIHGTLFNSNYGTIRNLKLNINEITSYSSATNAANYHDGTYTVYNGGVVGINETGGIIDNVSVTSTKTMMNDRNNSTFGGITGENRGTITNCTVEGTIYSTGDAGGIAGRSKGKIANCSFDGTIEIYLANDNGGTSIRSWGGIVGYAYGGSIENCTDVKVVFNYKGENKIYHNIGIFGIHSHCNLQIKVGVIIGHKVTTVSMINCSFEEGSNKLHLLSGNFHDTSWENKYVFANEDGKIGLIS